MSKTESGVVPGAQNPSVVAANVPFWLAMVLGAMAGGMAWGIRGQYGHETGAMIAGLLVSLVLILLIAPGLAPLTALRAVALTTVAIGIGGSMTYGQTVGLTHDRELVGNLAALRWGMIGLAIKGSIWIGFAGLFLGIGLGGARYRTAEMLALMTSLLILAYIGIRLINDPFDPANRVLPRFYFSDDWRWEPGAVLKPRREVWGGLLFALMGGWIWTGWFKRDLLTRHLVFWAMVGGAVGFPLGQSLQSFHAWNPEYFKTGIWLKLDPHMNWWNMMETTFGATMGGLLGLGLWLNRRLIREQPGDGRPGIARAMEWILLLIHLPLLLLEQFGSIRLINVVYDFGLVMAFIPILGAAVGRLWPLFVIFPVTLLPIAGKTIRQMVYDSRSTDVLTGWTLYGVLPVLVMIGMGIWAYRRIDSPSREGSGPLLGKTLLASTWIYFGLNYAFFHFPWPWETWTTRTPNAILFSICAVGLTWAALRRQHTPEIHQRADREA